MLRQRRASGADVYLYNSNGNPLATGQTTSASSSPLVLPSDLEASDIYRALPSSVAFKKQIRAWTSTVAGDFNTRKKIYSTTYTEQTSGAQRNLRSSSNADQPGNTGAYTVEVTFLDSSFNRQVETVTLAGTGTANMVSTTFQYLESMVVKTAGSGLRNAGTISLRTGTTAFASIGVGTLVTGGDNATGYAHHYVPTGKTAYIDSFGFAANNAAGPYVWFTARRLDIANAAEIEVGPIVACDVNIPYDGNLTSNPIFVQGPSQIVMYTLPTANATVLNEAWFSVVEF